MALSQSVRLGVRWSGRGEPGEDEPMSVSERVTPLMAAISAVSTLACCLPIGFAATAGAAGVLAAISRYRSWLVAISATLLTIGVAQVVRAQRTCRPGRRASLVILIMSTAVVAATLGDRVRLAPPHVTRSLTRLRRA